MSRNKSYTSLRSDSWTSVRTENTAREKSESLSGGKERDLRTEDCWVARPRFSIHTELRISIHLPFGPRTGSASQSWEVREALEVFLLDCSFKQKTLQKAALMGAH